MIAPTLSGSFAFLSGAALFMSSISVDAAPSDATRQQLDALVSNVKGATVHVYDIHDSTGLEMDSIKVIPDPNGGYIGVYHTNILNGTEFISSLSTSPDLVNWTYQCQLGVYASQPNISICPNGGFVAVWEQTTSTGSKNHIHFAYYPNRSSLLSGTAAQSFDAPMTLSKYAEGTPNIYSVTMTNGDINTSSIDTGGHYNDNTLRLDRQQRGTLTNFSSWTTAARHDYDNAILYWGVKGNIGDRDFLTYGGYQFNLMEGESNANDFGSWKIYNFDFQTGNADPLSLVTDGGSTSLGNPHWTNLIGPDGNPCLFCSAFIFSQNSASGEPGPLIYYITLPNPPTITSSAPSSTASVGTSYSSTLTATGYPAPTFSVASGNLPPGLSLTQAGVLSGTPTAAGVYSGTIQASNEQGTPATQAFNFVVTETYAQWANFYFPGASPSLSGPMATPQNDGVSNLLKFTSDIDPTAALTPADRAALPVGSIDNTSTPGTTYLTLTYRKSALTSGLTQEVQTSTDSQSWSTVTPDKTLQIGTDPTTLDPIIEVEVNSTGKSMNFIRLNVTAP
jgi:hypothetical protein